MVRGLILCGALAALSAVAPRSSTAQAPVLAGDVRVDTKGVADKLGVKTGPGAPDEIELGRSITTTLADPVKIAKFGVIGMHEGARVTITRIAPDRIRVEADEMEPVPTSGKVTLKVGTDGSLTVAPDKPPQKPPQG
jgi:hypothetical protein